MKKSTAVLVSGGLDSDALLAERASQGGRVFPLYVRQGLAWETIELYWLRRFLRALNNRNLQPLRILSLPMADLYGKHWSTGASGVPGARSPDRAVFLPGRNLVLGVKAAIFCAMEGIPRLAIGSLGHNPFPDASPAFFRAWANVLSKGLARPITIEAPYRRLSKAQVIRRMRECPLELSFSCLSPKGRNHCGRCNKCAERKKAFRLSGVKDKTTYGR